MNGFAPGAPLTPGERLREEDSLGALAAVEAAVLGPSSVEACGGGGEGGMRVFEGTWNGKSVGETYPPDEGPALFPSGSSSIGVIGGGGVSGGGGGGELGTIEPSRKGELSTGAVATVFLGRRVRCNRREEGLCADSMLPGTIPASSRMLPRSLPYAGGGASVPTLGARPHFLTFASMKTNPA